MDNSKYKKIRIFRIIFIFYLLYIIRSDDKTNQNDSSINSDKDKQKENEPPAAISEQSGDDKDKSQSTDSSNSIAKNTGGKQPGNKDARGNILEIKQKIEKSVENPQNRWMFNQFLIIWLLAIIPFKFYLLIRISVLLGYPGADFQANEKPKGGPLEIEFFCWGGLTKGVGGGQVPSKTLLHFFNKQKTKKLKSAPG